MTARSRLSTRAVRAAIDRDTAYGAVTPPIEHGADLIAGLDRAATCHQRTVA